MCGFVGIIDKQNRGINIATLKEMAATIHHRGPDAEGLFIKDNIGFFHKRLSIIDLYNGKQPMTFDGITLVYNGEIYNYIELRDDLKRKGHLFRTTSDTEVIIRMYLEYGIDFLKLLNGMFAFILYDQRKNEILITRDHFGIKPLYWYQDDNVVLFGSEIKAILKYPGITPIPNRQSINEYLTFQFVIGEETLFDNIYKVLPAHYMLCDCKQPVFERKKYWEPNFEIDLFHTEEFFVVELRKILEETISQQLRSDVPIGTYLSGGIDSSLITILSSRIYPHRLKSFTGSFLENPEFSEVQYARIASQSAESDLYEIYPNVEEFVESLPHLIYLLDEPVAGPGLFPQYIVSRLASNHVKVVLGGQGGDEIFGGYARYLIAYLEQALKGAINETNDEKEHIVTLGSILPNLPTLKKYTSLMSFFMREGLFESMDKRYFRLLNRISSDAKYFTYDFMQGFNLEDVFSKFCHYFNNCRTMSYFNKMTHFDMFGSLPGLLQVEDRVSMAVSIESRVPLLDKRIVDLIAPMPAGMKFKGAETKYLLKKTIKDILPKEILNRKDKMGFPVPLHIWSKNGARNFIMDTLLSRNARERNIIKTDCVENLLNSEQPFSRGLWGLLSLELWYNQFIDG